MARRWQAEAGRLAAWRCRPPWLGAASAPPPPPRSEAEELTFFSIFNQTVAHVVETLGVQALQVGAGGWQSVG